MDQRAGVYGMHIDMKNSTRKFQVGATKRQFVEQLINQKRNILQYRPATAFSRFCFSNPDSRIDFENSKISIPCNSVIEIFQKKSIAIMIRSSEVYNDNIS